MSLFATWPEFTASSWDISIGLVLIVKWTIVLALAWLAHGMLARRNPRWRVALWRWAIVGLALVAILSSAPPIVAYRFALPGQDMAEVERWVPTAQAGAGRATPAALMAASTEAIDLPPHSSSAVPTGGAAGLATTARGAEPAPGLASAKALRFRWGALVVAPLWSIWLTGVLVLTVRLIVGSLGLARLVRRSTEVPDAIVRECQAIALRLGCRRVARVRLTSEVSTPCLAGVVRPILLLPERECADVHSDVLRAILAHELAHARNHDLAWNLSAHVASVLLWFHPLAWRIRAAHAAACDAVCDAVAADLLGDVHSYGRTLARLALRAGWPAPVHGLAMARTSDVRRRVDALNRMVFRRPLSWRRVMPALGIAITLVTLIGGLGFTRPEQAASARRDEPAQAASIPKASAAAKPEGQAMAGKITLRAVWAETNEPIEGVSIAHRRSRPDGKNDKATVTTGKNGMATIDYPPSFKTGYFEITARMPRLVPIYLLWDDKRHPLELPRTKELRFESGTTIGGIVKDEAGNPIEGAAVDVYAPPTEYEGTQNVFSLGELKTDAQGRWRLDVAPRNLGGVSLTVEHPRYRRNGGIASRNLESAIVLTKGPTVTGRVVDAAGRPVKGARAIIGHDTFVPNPPTGTTNERGEFTLENCDRGPSIVTVQADGFAPQIGDVRVEEHTPPVEIQLTEPGSVLRGKVVDIEGKPVAGAFFGADTWRGHRSIDFRVDTDKDGRFEWKNAPKDVVIYDAGKFGYMSSRHIPLIAADREQVITLHPELVITGRVTDAETGRPLPKFRLIRGQRYGEPEETHWAENEAVEITSGRYTIRFSEPWGPVFVRVEAPGYQPADSRALRSTEGSQTFDFALRHGAEQVSGVVLLPDGKPAAGAEVVLFDTRTGGFLMRAGRFDRTANVPRVTVGPDGRFAFSRPGDQFVLIAMGDAGYSDASPDEIANSGKLVLRPWGKIEGEVRIGRQPASDQEVEFQPGPFRPGGWYFIVNYGYTTRTDLRGRFAFDRVVPGQGTVSRVVANAAFPSGFPAVAWQEGIEVKPNQTARVQVGGKGRPVIGRLMIEGTPVAPVDWTKSQPVMIQVPLEELRVPLGWRRFASHLDKDGRFHIDDVPPGKYALEVIVNAAPDSHVWGPGAEIGQAKLPVTVPEAPDGRPDEPLDLGTITVELFETLKVGDQAPDFTIPRIAGTGRGDQLRLNEYQGKVVLLDYWASWCGPCLAEMPAIKDIQQTFGSDTRFQLIGLSCDQTAEAAEQYIKENGLIWTHGFAGNLLAGVNAGKVYKVRAIPATFLIGPDGRIVAKNLRGAELKKAVRTALENPKLVPAAARTTPPPSSRRRELAVEAPRQRWSYQRFQAAYAAAS